MFIKILVIIIFCFIFWLICFKNTGTDEKNMLGFRSYPKEVQEKVYQDERLVKLVPKEINLPKIIVSNIILFTVVSCVPEKEYYQNPKKHTDSFLRGIPTFFVSALIVAGILSLLP